MHVRCVWCSMRVCVYGVWYSACVCGVHLPKDPASVSCLTSAPCLTSVLVPDPCLASAPLVQVYQDWDRLHVCSVVEVVGVLSVDPALASMGAEEEEEGRTAAERWAHSPPPSLVPRLHAITTTLLHHSNPLLPTLLPATLSMQQVVVEVVMVVACVCVCDNGICTL